MQTLQSELEQMLAKIAARHRLSPEALAAAKERQRVAQCLCDPYCPICGGVGRVMTDAKLGEPGFGKLLTCPNVSPLKIYPISRFGMEADETLLSWGDILPEWNETTNQGTRAVQETLRRGYGWVCLWGDVGLAKSMILKVAVAETLRAHRLGGYTRMVEILDHLKEAFDKEQPSESSQARLDWWASLPVLAIDEFSRVKETPWAAERRFLLMDRRYEDAIREKTITLIASNDNPAKLDGYLFDRIMDNRFEVVHLTGESYRRAASWEEA